jgi:WD40 repeat protein
MVDGEGIEITHEALIRHWPRLRRWLDDDRDGLRAHRQLTEATQVWEAHDRDRGSLLRGVRLTQAEHLPTRVVLTDRERGFLTASLTARTQDHTTSRRRVRRTRQLVALLAVLLVVACVSLVLAVHAQDSATEQRNAAVMASALSDATALRDTNPALSLQLTLAAYRADPTPRARDTLLNTLDKPYASRIDSGEFFVDAALLSPDGVLLVVPGDQRTGLWDVSDHYRPRRLPDMQTGGEVAAFGPDRTLLLKTRSGTYEVWDLRDPHRPRQLAAIGSDASHPYQFLRSAVAYSSDGRTAAVVDNDGAARLWDLTEPARPRLRAALMPALTEASDAEAAALASVSFSPDGNRLAVANSSHSVQLWDVTDDRPRRLAVLSGDTAAFTPDSRTLAVAGRRGSVQLWDLASARPLTTFASQGDAVSLTFSRGTGLLAIGDLDGSVGLWNVADPRRPVALTGLAGQLNGGWSTAFGPHGDTLVAAGHSSVWIWDLGPVLISHPDAVTAVRLNHRGDLLATGGRDHAVRLWRVDGHRSQRLAAFDVPYTPGSLSISPDDRTLVLSGAGPTQVWDITHPARPVHAADLPPIETDYALAFNPVDTTLVIGLRDVYTTTVYDLADPYHPRRVEDLAPFAVKAVAVHPDGTMLAVGRNSYTELWDTTASVASRTLAVRQAAVGAVSAFGPDGHTMTVFHNDTWEIELLGIDDPRRPDVLARFHPSDTSDGRYLAAGPAPVYSADGRLLATPDGERTIRLWDIGNPRDPATVTTFDLGREVDSLTLSGDGGQLFAATEKSLVQRRYLDVEDVADQVCAIAYPRMSAADWRRHFPNLPYEPPCR